MELKNKSALVTGAGKGIGRAVAVELAKSGADVAVVSRTNRDLQEVSREIGKYGRKALIVEADISRESKIKQMITDVTHRFGGLNILVNNAGIGRFGKVSELSTKDWDDMFEVNLRGMFLCIREALPYLRKKDESVIVNISSLAGKNTFAGGSGYTATKWGVMALSKCLMLEEREAGVRVLAVCPGSVDTRFFAHPSLPNPPKDKILKPIDVAETVVNAIRLPQRAMVSEIEIRPTNPK